MKRLLCVLFCLAAHSAAADEYARGLVRAAIDHWRGTSSYCEMTMVIHRPDWQRSMSMRGWTEGTDKSIVRITEPAKDRDNGTLTDGDSMWTYSPRVNRVIKVPSSMMNQSWMGSDFSNKDISRADDIVDEYEHSLLQTTEEDGHAVYEIESVPHEDAAVVWGKEVIRLRDDHVVLSQRFFDQEGILVKELKTLEIADMGGRTIAARQRMSKIERPQEWTEIRVDAIEYDVKLDSNVFTLSNLRNPRN